MEAVVIGNIFDINAFDVWEREEFIRRGEIKEENEDGEEKDYEKMMKELQMGEVNMDMFVSYIDEKYDHWTNNPVKLEPLRKRKAEKKKTVRKFCNDCVHFDPNKTNSKKTIGAVNGYCTKGKFKTQPYTIGCDKYYTFIDPGKLSRLLGGYKTQSKNPHIALKKTIYSRDKKVINLFDEN